MDDKENIVIRSELAQPLVHCILINCGKYVMQLRDEKPDINEPGRWGMFGGYREMFEMPKKAIARELKEELGLDIQNIEFCFGYKHMNVFEADISNQYNRIVLGEGQAFGSFTLDELYLKNTSKQAIRIITLYEIHKEKK